jgi:hypothetical protein
MLAELQQAQQKLNCRSVTSNVTVNGRSCDELGSKWESHVVVGNNCDCVNDLLRYPGHHYRYRHSPPSLGCMTPHPANTTFHKRDTDFDHFFVSVDLRHMHTHINT